MHWFVFESCNGFFYHIQARDQAEAEALLLSQFGQEFDSYCDHCETRRFHMYMADSEAAAELDALDLATLDQQATDWRVYRQPPQAA